MSVTQLQVGTANTASAAAHFIYRFGHFELDTRSEELRRNGYRVRLQDQPRRILLLFVERAGVLVLREQLQQALWSADTFVDFDLGLNAAVHKLRLALGDRVKQPRYIETISRRGYRFAVPVAMFEIGPDQPPPQLFPATTWLSAMKRAGRSTSPDRLR